MNEISCRLTNSTCDKCDAKKVCKYSANVHELEIAINNAIANCENGREFPPLRISLDCDGFRYKYTTPVPKNITNR